jgi:thiosulfate/3-mercaptopyruvate sulfurtransferase
LTIHTSEHRFIKTNMAARSRTFDEVPRVTPTWVDERMSRSDASLRVLDVRGMKSFVRGHVPGSVALDVRGALFGPSGAMVSGPELALAMSSLGVGDEHTVVLVDHTPPDAALSAAWALRHYGHTDVHLLEGGFARWSADGRPTSREEVRLPPASFTAKLG